MPNKWQFSGSKLEILIRVCWTGIIWTLSRCSQSKTPLRELYTSSRQPNETKVLCVQRDLQYGDFGSYHILKRESSKFIIMTQWYTSLSDNDVPSETF
jgi:hypothetical protein